MRNPFTVPLRSDATALEIGHPNEGYDFPKPQTEADTTATYPRDTPLAYSAPNAFQDSAPEYTGRSDPHYLEEPGVVHEFAQLAPAPGSANLIRPRDFNGTPGTNRLFKATGPVDGGAASPGWTGKVTPLRSPVIGNSGPVSGGRDGSQVAAQAYFAAQAAAVSQAASDVAMVTAL